MVAIISTFFGAVFIAIFVENAIFSRALGTSDMQRTVQDRHSLLLLGTIVTAMTTVSAVLSWAANLATRALGMDLQLRSVAFLCCVCITYQAACILLKKYRGEYYELLSEALLQAAFNTAVFGSLIISAMKGYGFFGFVAYGLGTGVGFVLAMFILNLGRQQLEFVAVPRAFRGLPVLMLYVGILSLAIYGLIGHQLPS